MSKNNLLNEGTIRRFMKLASVGALTDTFVEKLTETTQEETVEEGGHLPGEQDEPMKEMGGYNMGDRDDEAAAEEAPEEMEMDVEVDVDPVGEEAATVEDLARGLLDKIQELVPGLLDVEEPDDEGGEDAMDAMDAMDAPAPEEEMMEATEEAATEETVEEVNIVEDEDLISEVAKRVTARLVKSLAARKNS